MKLEVFQRPCIPKCKALRSGQVCTAPGPGKNVSTVENRISAAHVKTGTVQRRSSSQLPSHSELWFTQTLTEAIGANTAVSMGQIHCG